MDLTPNYRDMLLSLFPKGKAWFKEPGSRLYKLCEGLASELNRLHLRALLLIEEADPRTTSELLPDWQRALGLPDSCCPAGESTAQLRQEVVLRFKGGYGQSPNAFVKLAQDLGFTITVTPYCTDFKVGPPAYSGNSNCKVGGSLTNGIDWENTFIITAGLNSVISTFQVGRNVVGDALASWGNTQLECKVKQIMPAHSYVMFIYI